MSVGIERTRRPLPPGLLPTLLLAVVLVAALMGYLHLKARRTAQEIVLAAPLLPVETGRIDGILVTTGGAQFRLDRHGGDTWSLGGATVDFVDPRAMDSLLRDLAAFEGGAVLPGTEREDPRYEFNGDLALRVTFLTDDGQRLRLALGAANPVTGRWYASGLRRAGCFMVEDKVRKRLAGLPGSVQLKVLLPQVKASDLTDIALWRGETRHKLEQRDGRWWLQVPARGLDALGRDVTAYNAVYHDRVRTTGDVTWIMASTAAVGNLVHGVSHTVVHRIQPASETALWQARWNLDHPWRRVTLAGPGVNPDPTDLSRDRMSLTFGAPLGPHDVPVRRREVVLTADGEAADILDKPLGDLVHRAALTRPAMAAVRMELKRNGTVVLAGVRDSVRALSGAEVTDGREWWTTTVPAPGGGGLDDSEIAKLAGHVIVDIDRMPLVAVLPPWLDVSSPLQATEQLELVLTYAGADGPEVLAYRFGYLRADVHPDLTVPGDGPGPVALWRPDTGKLLQVSDGLLVTARSLAVR